MRYRHAGGAFDVDVAAFAGGGERPGAAGMIAPVGAGFDLLRFRPPVATGEAAVSPLVVPVSPTLAQEVGFISGLNADGTINNTSYWGYNGRTAFKYGDPTAGTGATVTYAFDATSGFTATEQQTVLTAMAMWQGVANVTFVQASSQDGADLLLHRGSDGGAYTTNNQSAGSGSTLGHATAQVTISIDTSQPGFDLSGSLTTAAGYGLAAIEHELGHFLGLGHAGNYNGSVNPSTQQFSAYDDRMWSTMSYLGWETANKKFGSVYPVQGTYWGFTLSADHRYLNYNSSPNTVMALDILAIQQLYGKPLSTPFSGGQTFGFNSNVDGPLHYIYDFAQNTAPRLTLYDTGTNNTLDVSGFTTNDTVNLNPGTFSSAGYAVDLNNQPVAMVNNICIAFGTAIDTVVCGSGNDTIVANLDRDTITGGGGVNTLSWAVLTDAVTATLDESGGGTSTVGGVAKDSYSGITNLIGGAGDDTLTGNAQNNVLDGGAGNDLLSGGAGDDTVRTGTGFTSIDGGTGFDRVDFSGSDASGITLLLADSGLSQATSNGAAVANLYSVEAIIGTNGDDVLGGNSAYNEFAGGDGNDVIFPWNDGDRVDGGAGLDTADFGRAPGATFSVVVNLATGTYTGNGGQVGNSITGIENVVGTRNVDQITGDANNNVLTGNGGNDTLDGGAGAHDVASFAYLTGGAGVTVTLASSGDTIAYAGDATTVTLRNIEDVIGGDGGDVITGNALANLLSGGGGDDTIAGGGGLDVIDGGTGTDLVSFGGSSGRVVADLSGGGDTLVTVGGATVATLRNVENLLGGSGDDLLTGGAGSTYLGGNAGNDSLAGGSAGGPALTLSGDAGNDQLVSRGDNVSLLGGADNDTLFAAGGAANVLDGGSGSDSADFSGAGGRLTYGVTVDPVSGDALYTIDGGGDGRVHDVEQVAGTAFDDLMSGGGAADVFRGNGGDDVLSGGAGNDVLAGLGDDDTLMGGAGLDLLFGGDGSDTASYADQTDAVKIRLLASTTYTTTFLHGVADDTLLGIENLTGGAGKDRLTGNTGANTLSGGDGADQLAGAAGNDVLIGGSGHDTLTGGQGGDTFVFADASGRDAITDFKKGDLIAIDVGGVDDFSDLSIQDDGAGGALIAWKGGSVDLAGVAATALKASAFQFGAASGADLSAEPLAGLDHGFRFEHLDAMAWARHLPGEFMALA